VCGSYQNWQRWVGESSAILALLVALVSVLAFAVPIWKREFYVPSPKPSIALIWRYDSYLHVTVSNGGDAPMTITRIGFKIEDPAPPNAGVEFEPNYQPDIVRPNEMYSYTLIPPIHANMPLLSNAHCLLDLTVATPSGEQLNMLRYFDPSYCLAMIPKINNPPLPAATPPSAPQRPGLGPKP
jgi:hypothetical protein